MKHYEVVVENGGYPLSFRCNTITEAFGCLLTLMNRNPRLSIDLDKLITQLVRLEEGRTQFYQTSAYMLSVQDGEA